MATKLSNPHVVGEAYITVGALRNPVTFFTLQVWRISPAVLKKNGLLFIFQVKIKMFDQNGRKFILHQNIQADVLKKNGGDEEDRTPDLLNANQALSQLSYVPVEENGGPGKI